MFIHFFLVYFQWYPHSEFLSAGSNLCYLCLSQLKSPCWLSLTNALQRRKVMFHFWFYGVAQGVLANSRFLCLSRLSVLFAGRKRAMENFCKVKTYTHLRSLNVLPLELYVGWKEFSATQWMSRNIILTCWGIPSGNLTFERTARINMYHRLFPDFAQIRTRNKHTGFNDIADLIT